MALLNDLQVDSDESTYFTICGWAAVTALYIGLFLRVRKKDPAAFPRLWQCTKNVGSVLKAGFVGIAEEKQNPVAPKAAKPKETPDPANPANDPIYPLSFKGFSDDPFEQIARIYEATPRKRRPNK